MPPKPFTPAQRLVAFWLKVDKNGPVPEVRPDLGRCWLWLGTKNEHGYGTFVVEGRRKIKAHHFLVGKSPNGLDWDQLCRLRHWVTPAHLEAVSRSVNLRRGLQSGLTPHCPHGHPFTLENTGLSTVGHRYCRACLRQRARRRNGWTEEAAAMPEKSQHRRRQDHCPQGHPYDAANTYIDRKGWQVCRTCQRTRQNVWRQRQRNILLLV